MGRMKEPAERTKAVVSSESVFISITRLLEEYPMPWQGPNS